MSPTFILAKHSHLSHVSGRVPKIEYSITLKLSIINSNLSSVIIFVN